MNATFGSILNIRKDNSLVERYRESNKKYPAIFYDRDGVLIKECHYISDPIQVELEIGAYNLVKSTFLNNFINVIITNQSGISRGIFNWHDYDLVTDKMISLFGDVNPFAAIYANSLGPYDTKNSWRKPSPKMLFKAANDLPIDLDKSILIGDRITDIQAGVRANLPKVIHIRRGHGSNERELIIDNINQNGFFIDKSYKSEIILLESLLEINSKILCL